MFVGNMEIVGVIPARFASTRLPGKPLLSDTGRPLIQHVVEAAQRSRSLDRIIVATDDYRIAVAVAGFGGEVVMTRADHMTGTDRVAEVAAGLEAPASSSTSKGMSPRSPATAGSGRRATATTTPRRPWPHWRRRSATRRPIAIRRASRSSARARGRALYFSRSPIPCHRDGLPNPASSPWPIAYLHLGLYAYRREFLLSIAALPPSLLEAAEKLEQLRVLDAGHPIAVGVVEEASIGIDTPEDYRRFVERWRADRGQRDPVATELGSPGAL